MMRSLYSGVSGLTTHQTRMDVIGNNIANVNTYGFKASRVTFRDIYYQTAISGTSGRQTYAGNNSSQVGYGVQLGSIDKDMSVSSFQNTSRVWDMVITGDGFFMTSTFDSLNLTSDKQASSVKYTRMGAFVPDNYGNLTTGNNSFVVGSRNNLWGLTQVGDNSVAAMNDVKIVDRNDDGAINSSDITFRNTINLNELMQQAYNVYTDDYGFMYGYDWDVLVGGAGDDGDAPDYAGAAAPTETGTSENGLFVYDLDAYGGTIEAFMAEDYETQMQFLDIQQTIQNLNTAASDPENENHEAVLSYRYYVDNSGQPALAADGTQPNYAELYTAIEETENLADREAAKDAAETAGAIIGELSFGDSDAVNVSKEGNIIVSYNDELKVLARIELAVFDNPDGLDEDGETMFSQTAASGDAKIKRASIDPGVTNTKIVTNKLEMSNVNLAQEFSDMIVTQRGFQANARIITTSDSMLEELVNLKR